jgi:hypothetical protein
MAIYEGGESLGDVAGKSLNSRFVGCKEAAWPQSEETSMHRTGQHA